MKPNTLELVPAFLRGYLQAAFFTNDDDAPGGCDYRDTSRPEEMFSKLAPEAFVQAEKDCAAFQSTYYDQLCAAGDDEQNGRDFWFTRNHHGVGFWDRGYDEAISKPLTDAAHAAGNRDLYAGDNGQLYFA